MLKILFNNKKIAKSKPATFKVTSYLVSEKLPSENGWYNVINKKGELGTVLYCEEMKPYWIKYIESWQNFKLEERC